MSTIFANSVFSLHVFRFGEPGLYNSIELVGQRKFRVVPSGVGRDDLVSAVGRVRVEPEPEDIPFPQADSFPRVVDLLTQLHGAGGEMTQDQITSNYEFDRRQTQYYTNAAAYLGLAERHYEREQGVTYTLTARGTSVMSRPPQERNLALAECVLGRRVFRQTLKVYLERGARPPARHVEEFVRRARPELTEDTIGRRAQTVLRWADWIKDLTTREADLGGTLTGRGAQGNRAALRVN